MEGPHRIGQEIRLRLHNLVEEVTDVTWSVNGVKVAGAVYTPDREGNCTIKAVISYPDGSQESLVKIINVVADE